MCMVGYQLKDLFVDGIFDPESIHPNDLVSHLQTKQSPSIAIDGSGCYYYNNYRTHSLFRSTD